MPSLVESSHREFVFFWNTVNRLCEFLLLWLDLFHVGSDQANQVVSFSIFFIDHFGKNIEHKISI